MTWELTTGHKGNDILKEEGPRGRWLFQMRELPGLGRNAVAIRHTIMAAPDMLGVLRELLDNRNPDYLHADDREMIREAIAKAEGAA